MTILVSSSNSTEPQIITETSKDLPRIVPVSTSTSCKFRVSLCQQIKQPKTPDKTKRKKEKKMKEEKGKRGFIRPRLVFPVKKMTCVISGVFSRKKTLKGDKRGQRDDSVEEITEAAETLALVKTKPKRTSLQKKRRQRRSLSEGNGEEELCKKRILMGGRCKPINRSGVLQYDGDGILVPDP